MDSLTQAQYLQEYACSPFHILHVYRHVDSEKVECNSFIRPVTSKTQPSSVITCSAFSSAIHGEQSKNGEHLVFGGAR